MHSHGTSITRRLATAALVLVLGACAGTGERPDEPLAQATATVGTDCFTTAQARDFRYLDDRNLIVFAPARRPHHLELSGTCPGLRGRVRIALSSRDDRMCGFAGDAVLVDGSLPDRCPVLSVRRLDESELQALLDSFELGVDRVEAVEVEIPAVED